MYKVCVNNNDKIYDIKVFDYELSKWAVSSCGTIFRSYSDALILKNNISIVNKNVYIKEVR